MSTYVLIFLAGVAGSAHCIGMCGGFACALGAGSPGRAAVLWRQLVYNAGRVTSYCFIGAVVGHLGTLLVGHGGEGTWASFAQRALAASSGLLMVYVGLQYLSSFTRRRPLPLTLGGEWISQGLRQLIGHPSLAAPLAFGVLNGLLPCPLVYAFAAQAAGSGSTLDGLLVMGAFGLGTFPAMLLAGAAGGWVRRAASPAPSPTARLGSLRGSAVAGLAWRRHGVRIAGAFIVVLGLVTLARGVLPMGAHLHGV